MITPIKQTHDRIWFGYTDLCVVLSNTIKSAWEYYRALRANEPEKFLGYDILLSSPERNLHGYEIKQFYIDPFIDHYQGSLDKLSYAIETLMWNRLMNDDSCRD